MKLLLIISCMQQLFSPIFLYSELLLCRAYLPGCVWIEVALLHLFNQLLHPLYHPLYDPFLLLYPGSYGRRCLHPDDPIQSVIAIFKLFDKSDSALIGNSELPLHCYTDALFIKLSYRKTILFKATFKTVLLGCELKCRSGEFLENDVWRLWIKWRNSINQ